MRAISVSHRLDDIERRLDALERKIHALETLPAQLAGVERTLGDLKFEIEEMQEAY